jgi:streptogramin lyase
MHRLVALAAVVLAFVPAAQAATGDVTQFPLPGTNNAVAIATGPDGNLWTTETDFSATGNVFAVMAPDGTLKAQYPNGFVRDEFFGISAGADGNVWFLNLDKGRVGRMTTGGAVTSFALSNNRAQPYGISAGPDGNVWFTEHLGRKIGRVTPAGAITEFPAGRLLTSEPDRWITAGADGNLWFTEDHPTEFVGRMTPAGALTEFSLGSGNRDPWGIAAGPDGNLWVCERNANAIARVTPSGQVTTFPLPRANSSPQAIATGSDGNLWFTEATMIGRITPAGAVTEYPTPTDGLYSIVPGPDGNLWLPGNARVSVARSGVAQVLSLDAAFQPARRGVRQGGSVQWTFYGPRVHEVADASGMGLFDSGPRRIVSSFSYAFTAAGSYPYRDPTAPALTGSISVPVVASPASGSTSTPFAITWATRTAATGFVYDVQVKRPGSTSYVDWRKGTTAPSASFSPDAGHGSYSFRARLRNLASGKASGWSAAKAISAG